MEFFPFFRRPYYAESLHNQYMQRQYQMARDRIETQKRIQKNSKQNTDINANENYSNSRDNPNSQKIMGFNSDDVLIILLLLFLYNEGVRDNLLFVVLILLLLT